MLAAPPSFDAAVPGSPAAGPCPGCGIEAALAQARVRLAEDLAIWTRVQEVSTRLVHDGDGDTDSLLAGLVATAVSTTCYDAGLVYLGTRDSDAFRVVSDCPCVRRVADAFASFGRLGSPFLPSHERFVLEDAASSSHLPADFLLLSVQESGFRGCQCTPLVGRDGRLLGGLVTFSTMPRLPGERDQRILDLLARQAADFTDRRESQEQVARSERRLRALVDSVGDAIVSVDSAGIIQTANPATGRLFGCAPDELVGQEIGSIMSPEGRERHTQGFRSYIQGAHAARILGRQIEVDACRRDGTTVRIEMVVSEVEPRSLFTAVMRDVTERRQVEARSRQADRLAALGTLAAGLGHDMNNVLFPIRAHLNAIGVETREGGRTALDKHLKDVFQGISYLQQLADGLHYLANDADGRPSDGDGLRLSEWWASTGALLGRSLPVDAELRASIPASLPAVGISPYALTQAVLNLVVNAGEAIVGREPAARRSPGRVTVSAHASADGSSVDLAVTDNGAGMTPEVRARALDLFFTTKTRGMGTGLGLAMVNRVTTEAGGSVTIETEPGRGTTITLRLPVAVAPEDVLDASVAITLADGRAAGFLESSLRARGLVEVEVDRADHADVWVVDPRVVTAREAQAWRVRRPGRTVVLFGAPHRKHANEWRGIAAATLEQSTNFDALLAGVDRLCAIILEREPHGADDFDGTDGDDRGNAGADAGSEEGLRRTDGDVVRRGARAVRR